MTVEQLQQRDERVKSVFQKLRTALVKSTWGEPTLEERHGETVYAVVRITHGLRAVISLIDGDTATETDRGNGTPLNLSLAYITKLTELTKIAYQVLASEVFGDEFEMFYVSSFTAGEGLMGMIEGNNGEFVKIPIAKGLTFTHSEDDNGKTYFICEQDIEQTVWWNDNTSMKEAILNGQIVDVVMQDKR